ncbi:hypothetical protein HPB50_010596 [Hyalomma asiaticum]|uniref:Uncharacterized protein n=1 Tax=Hyalomma asiaticum TaxID=266040 RepID=A0ACB7S1T8_HYAAI|nr:hypothetical protein HPB50_010596 [Hyalomma asiaticum]
MSAGRATVKDAPRPPRAILEVAVASALRDASAADTTSPTPWPSLLMGSSARFERRGCRPAGWDSDVGQGPTALLDLSALLIFESFPARS